MNGQISSSDWQILSDYLDRQLSPTAQKKLESALASRPELKQALEDLRASRAMLKKLPRRAAPKNFTLPAASLPRRLPVFPFVPAFSLASALCTILFVLSFLLQSGGNLETAGVNDAVVQSKAAAPMSPAVGITAPTPQVFIWQGSPAQQAFGRGGGGGSGGGPNNITPAGAAPPLPLSPPVPTALATPLAMSAKTAPTETPPSVAAPLALPGSPPAEDNGPILGLRPTTEQGLETLPLAPAPNPAPREPLPASQPAFPLVPLLFASLAVLFALTALLLWFRYRR